MALFFNFRYITFFLLFVCALSTEKLDKDPKFSFSFKRFEKNAIFESEIAIHGNAEVRTDKVLMFGKGIIMYKKPIKFHGTSPSFLTCFEFLVYDGIFEFLMVPNNVSLVSMNGIVSVKFVSGSYVAIDVGGEISVKTSKNFHSSGKKSHVWIDYDGVLKKIEVRVGKYNDVKRASSLVSCPVDLSTALWGEAMYIGMSSTRGNASVYSWSFDAKHGAPYLMHSEPLDPESFSVRTHEDRPIHVRESFRWKIVIALLIGAVFGALVASIVFILRAKVGKRHPIAPLEIDYEKNEKIIMDGSKHAGFDAK